MILSTIASYVALHLFCAVCLQWVREVTQNHLRQTYWYAAMTSCVIPCICHTFLMSLRLHWGLLVCQVIGKLLQTSSMHAHVSLNEWTSPKVMFCVPDGVQVMWDTKKPIACAWFTLSFACRPPSPPWYHRRCNLARVEHLELLHCKLLLLQLVKDLCRQNIVCWSYNQIQNSFLAGLV